MTGSRVPGLGFLTSFTTTLRDHFWVAVAIAAVLGAALALLVARVEREEPHEPFSDMIITVTLNAAIDKTLAVPNFAWRDDTGPSSSEPWPAGRA